MSRPSKTFLIEAGSQHFRVDLSRDASGYTVSGLYLEEPTGGGSEGLDAFDPLGTLETNWIPALLKQRPKPAAEVTILSDRLTVVVSEMPATPGEDWRSSAEMEAQTVSGLSTSEAVAASTRLPAESGMICCWVVQARMRDVAAMRSAVSEVSGSRLVAAGHPAGVRLDPTVPQLESWTEFSLFHSAGSERIELRGWNGPDALAEAREDGEVAASLIEAGESGLLLFATPDPTSLEEELASMVDFSTSAGVETWSAALARACDPLTGHLLGMPLVNVPKPPPSSKNLAITAATIAAAVAILLAGHHFLYQLNKTSLEEDLARLTAPTEKMASSRNRIQELNRELKELANDQDGSGESDVNVYAHRRRIGALLDGIAAGATVDGVVVVEFRPDKLDTVLTGAATTFNAPQTLAGKIDESLAANGWRASLVRRTAKLLRPDGGPWSFEIRLSPGRPVSVDEPVPDDQPTAARTIDSSLRPKDNSIAISF